MLGVRGGRGRCLVLVDDLADPCSHVDLLFTRVLDTDEELLLGAAIGRTRRRLEAEEGAAAAQILHLGLANGEAVATDAAAELDNDGGRARERLRRERLQVQRLQIVEASVLGGPPALPRHALQSLLLGRREAEVALGVGKRMRDAMRPQALRVGEGGRMRIWAWRAGRGRTQRQEADNDHQPKDPHRHGTDTPEPATWFHERAHPRARTHLSPQLGKGRAAVKPPPYDSASALSSRPQRPPNPGEVENLS